MRKNCAKKVQKTSDQLWRESEQARKRKEEKLKRDRELVECVFGSFAAGQLDYLREMRDSFREKKGRKGDHPEKDDLAAGRKFLIEEINLIEEVVTRMARLHDFLYDMEDVIDSVDLILKGN